MITAGLVLTAAVSASEISAGTILAGKYRVERLIGQGGMGVVVEARHTTLDDRVALKFLLPEYASHPEASARFLREARAAVKIKSSHVARVSDVGTLESGAPYMVMEFLEGSDAAQILAQGHILPVQEAIDLIVQAGDALAEAHSLGIIHRDVKPANLFVTRHNDGSPYVKVLDFGISKMANEKGGTDGLTRTTATMGSALYMSPEQIRQSKSVDHRTDIYALGVSLYEVLTGRQPFMAESFAALCVEIATGTPTPLRELRPDLPPELAAVIERAYARDRDQRFQNVGELVVALAPWAPARSQPIIERIARAAGLVPRFTSSPPPADPNRGSYAHVALSDSATRGAQPAATNMSGGTTVPPATRSPLRALLAVGAVFSLLAIVAVVAIVVIRSRSSQQADSTTPSESSTPAAVMPPAVPTVPEPPKVEPTVEEPALSAAPSASAAPNKIAAKTPAKPEAKKPDAKKPEPAKPEPPPEPAKPPPKKPNADTYR